MLAGDRLPSSFLVIKPENLLFAQLGSKRTPPPEPGSHFIAYLPELPPGGHKRFCMFNLTFLFQHFELLLIFIGT